MSKWINRIFKSQAACAALCVALGIFLIVTPEKFMNLVSMVISAAVIILGLVHVFLYMRNREQGFILDLLAGVLLTVIGIFFLINPEIFERLLPILLGAMIFVDSFWTFQASWQLKKLNFVRWPWLLGSSVLFVVLAAVMIFNPFETMKIATIFGGVVFLLNGLVDIFFLLLLKNKDKVIARMNEVMVMDANIAGQEGEVLDAEVDSTGHVIVEDVEVEERTPYFFGNDDSDIIDVEEKP